MRPLTAWAVLVSALCAGCGSSPALPVSPPVPVKGRVTFRGKPLTQGRIVLEPTDGGHDAEGTIQPDGTFALTTFKEGDGALLGVHRVVIADADRTVTPKKETHVRVVEGKTDYAIDLK